MEGPGTAMVPTTAGPRQRLHVPAEGSGVETRVHLKRSGSIIVDWVEVSKPAQVVERGRSLGASADFDFPANQDQLAVVGGHGSGGVIARGAGAQLTKVKPADFDGRTRGGLEALRRNLTLHLQASVRWGGWGSVVGGGLAFRRG